MAERARSEGRARGKGRARSRKKARRTFLRTLVAAGLGAVGARALVARRGERRPISARKIEVTATCIGCTGCIAVCPTAAIAAVPAGISVIDELCVSCGYCQAGCAVDGIRVLRGRDVA